MPHFWGSRDRHSVAIEMTGSRGNVLAPNDVGILQRESAHLWISKRPHRVLDATLVGIGFDINWVRHWNATKSTPNVDSSVRMSLINDLFPNGKWQVQTANFSRILRLNVTNENRLKNNGWSKKLGKIANDRQLFHLWQGQLSNVPYLNWERNWI